MCVPSLTAWLADCLAFFHNKLCLVAEFTGSSPGLFLRLSLCSEELQAQYWDEYCDP
jgi:hypothetical protein